MSFLTIIAYFKGTELGRCNYTYLEPIAYKSSREFIFKNFIVKNAVAIDNSGHSFINTSVYLTNAYGVAIELNKFKIIPLHPIDFFENGDIKIYGTIVHDWFIDVYNQPIIEIFNLWSGNQSHSLIKFPSDILKKASLDARAKFSGLPKKITKNEILIDGLIINDKYDFYLQLADKLVGERGFFGSCYNSLSECCIEVYKGEKDNQVTKIVFKNADLIANAISSDEFNDILSLLNEYKYL
ncbi:hypothetical protein GR160_18130 [Flavobacterium sp. Sd200]|uniref:hypothetical protein n=1 Tax=Flavobacterium sp. Sd200 TaxID=2692211 RepID=UPI00136E00D5|nr:hypothetical protein [Flavobacterium sp. Sd200]MXN93150.1 hypothetical protein [Flavobacterium sp. Sd200]